MLEKDIKSNLESGYKTMIDFSPLVFQDKNKERVQREAYAVWMSKNQKGTLELATGVGKTMIGLMAIQQNPAAKVYIVVPKIDLQKQWIDAITEFGLFPSSAIGRVGDGYCEMDKQIVVAVVNSIRDKYLTADLLIIDEMHRYGSSENFQFLKNGIFKGIMGLTATTFRQDGMHKKIFEHAPLIFDFNQSSAIKQGLLSEYTVENIAVDMTNSENDEYSRVQNFIRNNFHIFRNNFDEVKAALGSGGVRSMIAADMMRMFGKRRHIVLHAANKVLAAVDIIDTHRYKTLVFCEYIKTADRIITALKYKNIPAAKYHSKMSRDIQQQMLEDFKTGKYQVMVAVRSLDEGTNIPDCEAAIIVGGSSVERQMIQRLGRVLRKHDLKKEPIIYQLYIPSTKDQDWLDSRMDILNKGAKQIKWTKYKPQEQLKKSQ
jgi:superfamily II DNA or RNA helicase